MGTGNFKNGQSFAKEQVGFGFLTQGSAGKREELKLDVWGLGNWKTDNKNGDV